jgi:ribosomal protein S18 acetylase RimI-like enzyme
MTPDATGPTQIRALAAQDLDAVVAIDAAFTGRSRRAYFERRLASALRQPELHVQLAANSGPGLRGCILARRTAGEFGRTRPALRLEALGVRASEQGQGVGRALLEALASYGARHAVRELRTVAHWQDQRMLRWLAANGFELSDDLVLGCGVGELALHAREDARDDPVEAARGREIDYGAPQANDFERAALARCDVRDMGAGDLAQIVRIDRRITGRDRSDYIEGKLGEALGDSAVRVSLSAWIDGAVAGFVMARADLGDYGRAEPVAVLDTIGVDPDCAHRGVGRTLLAQLFAKLAALRIERVETVVTLGDLPLLGFLHAAGFGRSGRLGFVRETAAA